MPNLDTLIVPTKFEAKKSLATIVDSKPIHSWQSIWDEEAKYRLRIKTREGKIIQNKSKKFFLEAEVSKIKKYFELSDIFSIIITHSQINDNFVFNQNLTHKIAKLLEIPFNGQYKSDYSEFWLNIIIKKIEDLILISDEIYNLTNNCLNASELNINSFRSELVELVNLIMNQKEHSLIPVNRPIIKGASRHYQIIISNHPAYEFNNIPIPPKINSHSGEWSSYRNELNISAAALENLDLQLDLFHRIYRTFNRLIVNGLDYHTSEAVNYTIENLHLQPSDKINYALIKDLQINKPQDNSAEINNWIESFWKAIKIILADYLKSEEYISATETFKKFNKLEIRETNFQYPVLNEVVIEDFINSIDEEISSFHNK
jgi:hypothetical protein